MELTFIEEDSYRIALSELNKFVKKTFNNKYIATIESIEKDCVLNYMVLVIGYGLPDGSKWNKVKIDFTNITLSSLLSRFEQLVINEDEVNG